MAGGGWRDAACEALGFPPCLSAEGLLSFAGVLFPSVEQHSTEGTEVDRGEPPASLAVAGRVVLEVGGDGEEILGRTLEVGQEGGKLHPFFGLLLDQDCFDPEVREDVKDDGSRFFGW